MKTIPRLAAIILLAAFVFSFASCEYSEDVAEKISNYLEEEYPGKEFAIIDYEKHNETSGRYEVNVRCIDDGVTFTMYMYSSIAVTDGYGVERANSMMEEIITDELGSELSEKFKNIQWYDIYAERATNYRFREVEVADSYTLADLDDIYEVELASDMKEEDIGKVIYDFVYELCDDFSDKCSIDSVVFVFKVDRVTYRFTTDSESVLDLGKDGVVYYILTNIQKYSSSLKEVELEYITADEAAEAPETEGTEE